jgi:tetratricopeptide (TPR) repeat protein
MSNTLCFVLMPFGKKADGAGRLIDFDAVYRDLIKPAIEAAQLEPIRADEETQGGIIHKPMFERLVLCEYAVADLTLANANVFYELGVRHAVRPWRTVSIFSEGTRLPFDVDYLRSLRYALDAAGALTRVADDRAALATALKLAREAAADPIVDSPVFQLLAYLPSPNVSHEKTDLFREQVRYSQQAKDDLARARKVKDRAEATAAIGKVLTSLKPVAELEVGVLLDAMLSYRAISAWGPMVEFIRGLPRLVLETVMVQEQLGFALNRAGQGDEAEEVLQGVIQRSGSSPETLGILGRVYKDRWEAAVEANLDAEAAGLLDQAIETYTKGFESDWRDAYPGVNMVTLMEVRDPADPRVKQLLPIVQYSVERKIALRTADYWDHATLLELGVVSCNEAQVTSNLGKALRSVRESWEPETTVKNLRHVRRARKRRGISVAYADAAEVDLRRKAGKPLELD